MKKNEKKVPFFANLLEKQITASTVKGGGDDKKKKVRSTAGDPIVTMKYPSDADEPTFEPEFGGW